MSESKHFELQQHDDVIVLHLLDQRLYENVVIGEFEDELLGFIDDEKPPKLLINFGPVALCGTAAINALLRAKSRMLKHDGQLKFCGMNEPIRAEFQMLNLDGTVFDIYEHASDAFDAFDGNMS